MSLIFLIFFLLTFISFRSTLLLFYSSRRSSFLSAHFSYPSSICSFCSSLCLSLYFLFSLFLLNHFVILSPFPFFSLSFNFIEEGAHSVVDNVLDNHNIINVFEPLSRYTFTFQMNPLMHTQDWIYVVPSISFQTFVQAFKLVVDSWKVSMLLLYILWDDWPIFMISSSKKQLQQEWEYTLLKPDCHSWWISKMQSGRDETLEEWYAIKFCFKLGKNATETYGTLQAAFRPSCMNRASVFEWHKRFKEGTESVREDERCGRSKEVNTPELIGQRVRVTMLML